jgi:hypothetical protein
MPEDRCNLRGVQEGASAAVAATAALSDERARAERAEARLAEAAAAQATWGPALAARDSAAVREARNSPPTQHANSRVHAPAKLSPPLNKTCAEISVRLGLSLAHVLARQHVLQAIHAPQAALCARSYK